MQIIPVGKIWLLHGIPWSSNYQHTKYFASALAQHSWICNNDHIIGSANPKTAQNQIKDVLHGTIKVEGYAYTYRHCNYMCFQNTDINESLDNAIGNAVAEDKYYYCFVDAVRYVSNKVFEVDYTVDVLQTYLIGQGSLSLRECYVERIHPSSYADDKIGNHIEPEPVSFGTQKITHIDKLIPTDYDVVVFSSEFIDPAEVFDTDSDTMWEGKRCGLFQGLFVEVVPQSRFMQFMQYIKDNTKKADSIIAMVAVPQSTVQAIGFDSANDYNYLLDSEHSMYNAQQTVDISYYNDSMDGYSPINNKLFTYPYNLLVLSTGEAIQELEFEKINKHQYSDNTETLMYQSVFAVQPTPEYMIIPINYQLSTAEGQLNIDKAITLKSFQTIPWSTDSFQRWYSYNQMTSAMGVLGSILSGAAAGSIAGVGIGSVGGAIAGGVLGLLGVGAQAGTAALHPNQAQGSLSGTGLQAIGEYNIRSYRKSLYKEDAERIDNFFTAFGYAKGIVMTPYLHNSRTTQNYIKTSGITTNGYAPTEAIKMIESIFNDGITVWDGTVGNYEMKPTKE